jgi:hypothetical protein
MALSAVTDQICATLNSRSNALAFQRGRAACETISSFETIADLMDALRRRSEKTAAQREQLTRAVIQLFRRTRDRLWSSVLVVLYYPLLCSVRKQLVGGRLGSDDLDQLVLDAFMTALAEPSLDKYQNVAFGIWQLTRRRIFETLRREHQYEQHIELPCDDALYWDREPINHATVIENTCVNAVTVSVFLRKASEEGVNEDGLEVVTRFNSEDLRSYCAGSGATERDYQRLKKRRDRAMRRLREMAAQGE